MNTEDNALAEQARKRLRLLGLTESQLKTLEKPANHKLKSRSTVRMKVLLGLLRRPLLHQLLRKVQRQLEEVWGTWELPTQPLMLR